MQENLPKNVRAMFYAINGLGLGHLTRLLAICRAMQKICPSIEPLFVTTSDADNVLSKYRVPYVHLPSKTVAAQTDIFTHRKLARLYNGLLNPIYDIFQPHLLIVDTMTTGALHDLLNILRFGNTYKVFIHRARKTTAYEQFDIQAQRFYDLVIAPHYANTEVIPMPVGFDVPLYWSGPILLTDNNENYPSRSEIRRKWNINDDELFVLISLGGGGDAKDNQTLKKITNLVYQYFPQLRLLFAKGLLSFYDEENFQHERLLVTNQYPMTSILAGVDFAIAGAGYNTFHELLHFGVPSIFIPRERGYDDQLARSQRAAASQACLFCLEDDFFMDNLRTAIQQMLHADIRQQFSKQACAYVPRNHAKETAEIILRKWQEKWT